MSDLSMTPLPNPKDVREALEGLLGRDVDVAIGDPFSGDARDGSTYAVYVDDRLRTVAVAVADLGFSAYAGAAIGLVPVGGAELAVEERELSPMLQENLYEVLNVCAALLNAEGHPHVKLYAVHHVGQTPPTDVPGFAAVTGRRLDLHMKIAMYGAGKLSIVCVG